MELVSHPALKISGVEALKAPGPASNYLDWALVLEIHFRVTGVSYVIKPPNPNDRNPPRATFEQDNLAVCSVISRTVESINLRYIRTFAKDARGM